MRLSDYIVGLALATVIGWGMMFGGVGIGLVPYLSTGPMLQIHGRLG